MISCRGCLASRERQVERDGLQIARAAPLSHRSSARLGRHHVSDDPAFGECEVRALRTPSHEYETNSRACASRTVQPCSSCGMRRGRRDRGGHGDGTVFGDSLLHFAERS